MRISVRSIRKGSKSAPLEKDRHKGDRGLTVGVLMLLLNMTKDKYSVVS